MTHHAGADHRAPRFCLWFVRWIAGLVPSPARDRWRQEWVAEITHRSRRISAGDLRFGGWTRVIRISLGATRDAWHLRRQEWRPDMLWQELRYALRGLIRNPSFTLGVRIALGAAPERMAARVVGQTVLLTVTGIAIGLAAAAGLTRLLDTMLFGVEPLDPVTFIVVPLLLAVVGAIAGYLPARRAASLDPMGVLREE